MLLCDSRHLYCHCSTHLAWLTRRAPFGEASLIDTEMSVDFATETTPRDIVTVIATKPLTDNEDWTVMAPGRPDGVPRRAGGRGLGPHRVRGEEGNSHRPRVFPVKRLTLSSFYITNMLWNNLVICR